MSDSHGVPPEKIVISTSDLDESIDVGTAPGAPTGPAPAPGAALPNLPAPQQAMSVPTVATAATGFARFGRNSVVAGLAAGLVGGVLGMLVAENVKNPDKIRVSSISELRTESGIWVAIFGAVLGFVILAWEGFTSGSPEKGFRDGAIGALVGGVSGFIGGYLAQMLFENLLEDLDFTSSQSEIENRLRIARTVAWAAFGGLAGLGLGIRGGARKVVNGLIGGTIGGALGGLVFEQIEISMSDNDDPPVFLIRLIGLTLTGIGIGLGIGLVERIRRDAWLLITTGPMAGKEFILYNDSTTVGADFRSDIVLVKDRSVAPAHAVFVRDPYGGVAVRALSTASVLVNGTPVHEQRLRPGDQVTVGASSLHYLERAAVT